jgi:hypothetical protein
VGTTTIVINAGDATHRSAIHALGMEEGSAGLTIDQRQARAAVNDLRRKLMELTAFEPQPISWEAYQYKALAVYSRLVDSGGNAGTTDIQPNLLDWPLADLRTAGEPAKPEGVRRVLVSEGNLEVLRPLLSQATQITLWRSDTREYHLYFRPLLPEEEL